MGCGGGLLCALVLAMFASHRADVVFRTQPQNRSRVEGWIKAKEGLIRGDDEATVRNAFGDPSVIFFWVEVRLPSAEFLARQIRCGTTVLDQDRENALLALLRRRERGSLDEFSGLDGTPANQLRDLLEKAGGDDFEHWMVWRYPNESGSGLDFNFENGKVSAIRFFE